MTDFEKISYAFASADVVSEIVIGEDSKSIHIPYESTLAFRIVFAFDADGKYSEVYQIHDMDLLR